MMMMPEPATAPTPASEKSVYYDACHSFAAEAISQPKAAANGSGVADGPEVKHVPAAPDHPSPAYEATEKGAYGFSDSKADSPPAMPTPVTAADEKVTMPVAVHEKVAGDTGISSPTSVHSGDRVASGAFASGAGLTGPAASVPLDATLHERSATAESNLDPGVKARITKEELKNNKRLSKIIKSEAKAEKKSMEAAIKDLAKLHKIQKQAISDENKATSKHAKATKAEHKLQMAFLSAKQKYEQAAAELKTRTERLEACKEHALKQTEMLQQKSKDVEELRIQKGVDDREREAKLKQLSGK